MKTARFFSIFAAVLLFVGCGGDDGSESNGGGNNGGGDGNKEIVVPNQTQLSQTVYADQTQGASGVSFTTTGAWRSEIAETRGAAPDWLSISPDKGDKAGDYTIAITLGKNLTGADRKATITIVCGETRIAITVEQKAEKQEDKDPVTEKKLISKITLTDDDNDLEVMEFKYDNQNRVSNGKTYQNGKLSYEIEMTYAENKITTVSYNYEGNNDSDTEIYTLKDGRVVSSMNPDEKYDTGKWEYDANGYLTRWTQFYVMESVDTNGNVVDTSVKSDISDYTWSDGNISKMVTKWDNSDDVWTFDYTYTTLLIDKANLNLSTSLTDASDMMQIFGYAGKQTKNLVEKETISGDKWGKDNGSTTYRYVTDANGYVTEVYTKYQPQGKPEEAETLKAKIEYK